MEQIKKLLATAVKSAYGTDVEVELSRPDEQFGDFATNVALQLAKQVGESPRSIAEKIVDSIPNNDLIAGHDIAGPGFINIVLTDEALLNLAEQKLTQPLAGKTIVAEYSDPNPFKVLHAGHLYTSIVGDAIANLLENAGAKVQRVNFGGDVGLHVGKTMWAILKRLGGENPDKLSEIEKNQRSDWMAAAYVEGNNAYDDDKSAKQEMIDLNKRVYRLHQDGDHDSPFAQIYWTCRQWSYEYFDEFYARIGSKFEKYYPESEVAELGLKTVQENKGKVFVESDGAIVFRGEDYGLHTRVFINSEGIPTYEAKDVGLIMQKKLDYDFDRSVVITGNEQDQYMQVVLKAVEQFAPELANATTHLTHGMVKLKGGVKMSSRKGNILRALDVLDMAAEANKKLTGKDDSRVVLAAVKYSFLKQRLGGDIIYDPEGSVAVEGNSGPYIQYAHARAASILRKANHKPGSGSTDWKFNSSERTLVRKLGEFGEVIGQATEELAPHVICSYLYELAQVFNRFYEQNRVIGSDQEELRINLVGKYKDTLSLGLELLGIHAPEKM